MKGKRGYGRWDLMLTVLCLIGETIVRLKQNKIKIGLG